MLKDVLEKTHYLVPMLCVGTREKRSAFKLFIHITNRDKPEKCIVLIRVTDRGASFGCSAAERLNEKCG